MLYYDREFYEETNKKNSRNWCFTAYSKPDIKSHDDIIYYIYQSEICPTTKRLHYQGYAEFSKPQSMKMIKKLFNDNTIHLGIRKGNQEQAINYCKKKATSVPGSQIEYGTPTQQGKRNDIKEIIKLPIKTIIEDHPEFYLRYNKGINDIKNRSYKPQLRLDIKVILLHGKPGSGKTRYVYDNHDIEDIYKLNTNSNGTLWFDGYDNQSVLLIDDFKGWIKYTELLTLLDIYPYRCQLKGSYIYANWKTVYITSNYDIDEWYSKTDYSIDALKRRVTEIKKI